MAPYYMSQESVTHYEACCNVCGRRAHKSYTTQHQVRVSIPVGWIVEGDTFYCADCALTHKLAYFLRDEWINNLKYIQKLGVCSSHWDCKKCPLSGVHWNGPGCEQVKPELLKLINYLKKA